MSCGCHQAQHYVNTGKSFFFQKFGKNSYLLYCYEGKKKIEDTKGVTESVSKVKKTNNNKCKEWSTNITQVKQYEQHKTICFISGPGYFCSVLLHPDIYFCKSNVCSKIMSQIITSTLFIFILNSWIWFM